MRIRNIISVIFICFYSLGVCAENEIDNNASVYPTVRVAFFPIQNIYEKSKDNQYIGFACEFVEEIAHYASLSIEWVDIPPQEAVSALQNNKVDLIATIYQSPSYNDALSYSQHHFHNESGLLLAKRSNNNVYYQDYEYFKGKTVAVSSVGMIGSFFQESMAEHDFEMTLVEYVSYSDMQQALKRGEVDFIATSANFMSPKETKIVDVFPTAPFYLASRNSVEGDALLHKIDRAISKLRIVEPDYEEKLYQKYLNDKDIYKSLDMTREETNFIKQHNTIKMGTLAHLPPYAYSQNGTLKGFSIDYIKYLAKRVGFNIEFIKKDNVAQIKRSLANGEIDLANFLTVTTESFSNPDFAYSKKILYGNLKVITHKDTKILSSDSTIGVPANFSKKMSAFKEKLPHSKLKLCVMHECVDDLESGEIDAFIHGEYYVNYIKQIPKYEKLEINILDIYPLELHYVINTQHMPLTLINILNKAIDGTEHRIIDDILLNMSVNSKYQLSFVDFIVKYRLIIILLAIITIISIMTFYFYINNREQVLKSKLFEQEKERLKVKHELYESLRYDKLTGLAKLETFFATTNEEVNSSIGWQGIACFDIYRFSAINEYYGRTTGDELLCELSKRLTKFTTPRYISRYGGDEFCIFLSFKNEQQVENYLDSLNECIIKKYIIRGVKININCHYGISKIENYHNYDPNVIYHQAALALNKASQANAFKPVFFDAASQKEINHNLQIINLLSDAIKNNEIKVYYQPQISTQTGKIISVEALIRWVHQDIGFIPPDKFIHIAEQHNLISLLDNYVLETACREILSKFPNGEDALHLSVNISAAELFQEEFLSIFTNVIRNSGLSLSRVTVEVTESIMINDYSVTVAILDELRSYGLGVSVDDFGTGYSSLSYINTLPITELKIDKSFIDNIFHNQQDQDLIRSILAIGKISKSKIVAEGVETKEQAQWLKEAQCDLIQGYYYAKPMPIDELILFTQMRK